MYSKKKISILYKSQIKQNIFRGFKISGLKILIQIVGDRTSSDSMPTRFDVSTYQIKIVGDRPSPDSIPTTHFHVRKYQIKIVGDQTSPDSIPTRFHENIHNNQAYNNNHINTQSIKSIQREI